MAVRWVRLSDIALKGVDQYMCAGCGRMEDFERMWSAVPYSAAGKQMMQGYIHCKTCRDGDQAIWAWKKAHDKENPH